MWSPSSTEDGKGGGSSSVCAREKRLLLNSTDGAISGLVSESVEPKKIQLNNRDTVSSMGWGDGTNIKVCSVIGTVSTEGRHRGTGNN